MVAAAATAVLMVVVTLAVAIAIFLVALAAAGAGGLGAHGALAGFLYFFRSGSAAKVNGHAQIMIDGVQEFVNGLADIGMTFAAALRAMLRQAPNIIMIGEIRDMETASIAINASLTGHLVFSTLHTNDAPSAVARLADIGIKRFLIASSVRAIMAQRLVRKLCDRCKVDGTLTEKQAHTLNIDMSRLAQGQIKAPHGCDFCRGGGFKGRMGLFEIFEIDDEVRRMINENLTSPQLRQRARELGMRTLREDGVRKVLAGLTSPEEVLNVTMGDAN